MIFKSMIVSLLQYSDIIYEGTTAKNLEDINRLYYRGLRICCQGDENLTKAVLCNECHISAHEVHLLTYMQKQKHKKELLKPKLRNTRLHQAPVFNIYKPNNEKAKQNIFYRGAMVWNSLAANNRNIDVASFMSWLKRELYN